MTASASAHVHSHVHNEFSDILDIARHAARLLITLYHLGVPSNSMFEGETRQVESIWQLRQFGFWLNEPGHLALALLKIASSQTNQREAIQTAVAQMLIDRSIDVRRVEAPGATLQSLPDLHALLSFLTSRSLVSDRPSFGTGQHQIVLDSAGIEFVGKILSQCPSFGWYDFLGQTAARFWPWLEHVDLATMAYLQPDLSSSQASVTPLHPIVRARFLIQFPGASLPI